MKPIIPLILICCILLGGCGSLLDSNYHNVKPHEEEGIRQETGNVSAHDYESLCTTLIDTVKDGTENVIISVADYDQVRVSNDMERAVAEVLDTDPIAAYAVESIVYELGTNAGQPAVAVTVTYLHDRTEIRKIHQTENMDQAARLTAQILDGCDSGIVLYVEHYEDMDFVQWVEDYAAENPDMVMELPQVTANLYPETGTARVVELKFAYQNSRDVLRDMQDKVSPLFHAAAIYAGEDGDEAERYFKLYSFLMGLFQNYTLETSITPAYSLLQHGVGDSKTFATVYGAMCEEAGLACIPVTGTRSGEPWYWNIICCEGVWYHVDLWESHRQDSFIMKTDGEMAGYVWDFSAYPACGAAPLEEK